MLAAQGTTSDSSTTKVPSHHAIGFGYFATLGSYWQIEAAEIGYVRRMSHGLAAFSVSGRVGTFIDETGGGRYERYRVRSDTRRAHAYEAHRPAG